MSAARQAGRRVAPAAGVPPFGVTVENLLPLIIDVFERNPTSNGTRYLGTVKPTQTLTFGAFQPSIRVLVNGSGSIIVDRDLPLAEPVLSVDPLILRSPNHLPAPVAPSVAMPIPPDSVPYLVGVGRYRPESDAIVFAREQFWHKAPESFGLPPRSSLQKILRQTSGRTASSSTSEQVTTDLSLTAGAGWGPFSAAASASLSTTSQRTDTVTIREESASTVVQTFINESDAAVVVCLWQLVDRIRVFKGGASVANVDNGLIPLIPMSYDVS
jgi:hypothetical protein